ncbi:putative baseplate assembly protein [Paractinoplanes deccanensis]|uniref:Baseplate assembly protein n=1 Tax=Paractinoplanes deccanensis TaxID=113561 RepID=A0ABQ3XYN9_9ACTN|nr:putative baseplate assembly protein [Actinoplanes deccanensis]GID72867.1 putative baseplate assembly protein [Actinoplanes deccanensis]
MALRSPILDDRSYAQLRDELVARIPVYAPEWTDHHPSDPGITLVELFAFLAENLLFRFNQIPEATKLAFLDLLDIPVRPAVPASGTVVFGTADPAGIVVAAGTPVLAGPVEFRTGAEVTAWPLTARAAIRARHEGELDEDTAEYLARASAAAGTSVTEASRYRTAFGAADPQRPGGDVLDPAASIDGRLYVLLTSAIVPAFAGRLVTLGVVPARRIDTMADVRPCGDEAGSEAVQWQIATTTPVDEDDGNADPVWRTLAVEADTTAALTRPGQVRLRMPADLADIGLYLPDDPDATGSGDQPPLLEDDELIPLALAWLRAYRPAGAALPAVEWVGANAAPVEQAAEAAAEFLGTGTGEPGQEYRLVHPGVLGDVALDVEEQGTGRWRPWSQVGDLRAAGVDDRVFTVDREAGVVRFGDGRRGRPPQIGERIRAGRYRYGGGAAGNAGPGAITVARPSVPAAGLTVANPIACRGGADAEALADAVNRIPEEFRRHDRAVTVSDFRELAEQTPGAGVVRAETLRLFNPHLPGETTPGAVSVVVWPAADPARPAAPMPGRDTLRAVCRWLDERRLITTELYVIPPTYRRVAVSVGIAVKPGYGTEGVRAWVDLVLRQYLSPLPPYGPEGRGWPLGRAVFGPELEAAALQVEGLEFLTGLRVAEWDDEDGWREPAQSRVELAAWEVPELTAISVTAGDPLPPGEAPAPPGPPGPPVPVRAPREVC